MILALLGAGLASSQVGRVGINTDTPRSTLHVVSKGPTTQVQGITFPYGDQTQIDSWGASMGADNVGTVVYNTNQGCLEMWVQKDNAPTFGWMSLCGGERKTPITPVPPGTPVPPSPLLPPAIASTSEIPTGMEVADGGLYLASIYDTDYLPYTGDQSGTAVGKVGPYNADGSTLPSGREPVIDYQKTIDHNGIQIALPIKSIVGTTINIPTTGLVFNATVPKALTSDGVKDIDMELVFDVADNSGVVFNTIRKYLVGKLRTKNSGDILKPIKLDINVGNGSSGRGVPLAEFVIPHQSGGASAKFHLNAVTGIPDKYFDVPQDSYSPPSLMGKYMNHFVYVPMFGWDGNVWLSKNLGAMDASLDKFGGVGVSAGTGLQLGEFRNNIYSLGGLYNYYERPMVGYWLFDYRPSINRLVPFVAMSQIVSGGVVANHCPAGYQYPLYSDYDSFMKYGQHDTHGIAHSTSKNYVSHTHISTVYNPGNIQMRIRPPFPSTTSIAVISISSGVSVGASSTNLGYVNHSVRCIKQ